MPVTWHTVRRLFSGIDIATMRELGHPLDNYEYVAQNANVLLKRLEDGSMPPPPFGPWEQKKIDTFQEWIDDGFLYKSENDDIPKKVDNFIGLSQALTGFDDLGEDPELAAKHFNSMRSWTLAFSFKPMEAPPFACVEETRSGTEIPTYGDLDLVLHVLLVKWDEIEQASTINGTLDPRAVKEELEKFALEKLLDDSRKDFVGVVKAITRLWYTGSLPTTNPFLQPLSKNQWTEGLMWRAALAHPPGFSTEGSYRISEVKGNNQNTESIEKAHPENKQLYGHWAFKPEPSGKFTGLGYTATHFKSKGV